MLFRHTLIRGHLTTFELLSFCCCNLDLDPVTSMHELELNILKMSSKPNKLAIQSKADHLQMSVFSYARIFHFLLV